MGGGGLTSEVKRKKRGSEGFSQEELFNYVTHAAGELALLIKDKDI